MIKKIIFTLLFVILCNPVFAMSQNITVGRPSAPLELKLYYSMTCPACGRFHNNVVPLIEKNYINTGKAKLTYIPYPLDVVSLGIEAFLYCISNKSGHYNALNDILSQQHLWLQTAKRSEKINDLLSPYMSTTQREACQKNEKSLERLIKKVDVYKQKRIVRGTPTLFINGIPVKGGLSYDNIKRYLDASLRK